MPGTHNSNSTTLLEGRQTTPADAPPKVADGKGTRRTLPATAGTAHQHGRHGRARGHQHCRGPGPHANGRQSGSASRGHTTADAKHRDKLQVPKNQLTSASN